MTRKTLHALVAIIVGLVLLLFVMQRGDRDEIVIARNALLPDLQAVADEATEVRIVRAGEEESITIRRANGAWVVSEKDDYPADVAKLRQLIVALAYASVMEEKTSMPEQYGKLGVDDPEDGGKGTKVVVSGPEFAYAVILGNVALRDSRYARIADEATSYLVDRNPEVPEAAADWLTPGIVDIASDDVRRVVISHADGETLTIEKTDQEQTDFGITDIPAGRELSYATVGNGIAGALGALELDDVRKRVEGAAVATTVFETWEGLRITVTVRPDEADAAWVEFAAEIASEESVAREQATTVNDRVSAWQYRIPDYKQNLLTRRWADILKSPVGE